MKRTKQQTVHWQEKGQSIYIESPVAMPKASHFLWNKNMVAQVNCRGYVIAQFMQPEPAKYAHGPNLEAKTFIQPEQPFYTEHPGRFFYIKNRLTQELVSLPYEPMRQALDKFKFSAEMSEVRWQIEHFDCRFDITMHLDQSSCVEYWALNINQLRGTQPIELDIYTCFSIGYMSWMNQSADFYPEHNAIIASSVSPYQKVEDYPLIKRLHDKTFLMADRISTSWCCSFADFVGEGGLTKPDALINANLSSQPVNYETPIAVMQHHVMVGKDQGESLKFLFGPARSNDDLLEHAKKLQPEHFLQSRSDSKDYVTARLKNLQFRSPNKSLNHIIDHWLPRQAYYHGDVNRLSTDPQTRNFLQDAMGMIYLQPEITRERLLFALKQQASNGELPDGILLTEEAELKYINQVPHADHNVWLPLVILAYLEQTGDDSLLHETCTYADKSVGSVIEHVEAALDWLLTNTDQRGLSLIAQGDWCDPMNMVGHQGRGVSAWLTFASAYAIQCWLTATVKFLPNYAASVYERYQTQMTQLNKAAAQYFYDGHWYGRGITDNGRLFGTKQDQQGKMFLNAQSWAMLCGVSNIVKQPQILTQINQHLLTPYGHAMLAPAFTKMVEDVGRITQKSPGVSENGSVYNHAAIFYSFALFEQGQTDQAFDVFQRMLALPDNEPLRDQLPNFVPNYYRGSYFQFPEYAGRSSHLFNTGTVSWLMRIVNEQLCGFKGVIDGVSFAPQIPSDWPQLSFTRYYRQARFEVDISRSDACDAQRTICNTKVLDNHTLVGIEPNQDYHIQIILPVSVQRKPRLDIIMGVSGSGKTTVAETLAAQKNAVFIDADDFHSPAAKQQMSHGTPLNDAYREGWIAKLTEYLLTLQRQKQDCVLAYSGLKAKHRDRFRQLGFDLTFYKLNVCKNVLEQRLQSRTTHFFDPRLLASQLQSMEAFQEHETDAVDIDAAQSKNNIITKIRNDS